MVRYLSDDVAEWGNETSMKLVGIRKFESDYYIPYTTDDFWKPFSPGRNEDIQRIKNQSFTKRTVRGANAPIVIVISVDVATDMLLIWRNTPRWPFLRKICFGFSIIGERTGLLCRAL